MAKIECKDVLYIDDIPDYIIVSVLMSRNGCLVKYIPERKNEATCEGCIFKNVKCHNCMRNYSDKYCERYK